MKKILLILCIYLSITSCKKNTNRIELNSKTINEIAKAVLLEEEFTISTSERKTKLFSEELIKVNIRIPETQNIKNPIPPPAPFFNDVNIEELITTKIENKIFFTSKDSLYILKQNANPEIFNINKKMFSGINLTTKEIEINKKKKNDSYDFYEMSIPILSLDDKKAYVLLNHYCGHLCGNGKELYLEKINGKWKIVKSRNTWIS